MDLIVAEKPSVARDIARVLGATKRGEGCLEGPSHVVTWCIGHLLELEEPAHYDERWKPWRLDTLPMIPARFELRPVKTARAQWNVVRALLRDRRFARVVNACDAGREGELIFRHCYELAGSRLPMARLWVSSLTDAALRGAFAKLAPGERYDPLADAARCRSEADWLVGLNATRALTVRARFGREGKGALLSIGRVQTPTLAMVVERDRAIRAFVPRDYWEVFGSFRAEGAADPFRARWTHDGRHALATKPLADALVARVDACRGGAHDARVEQVSTKAQRVPPPLLYDLTTLQRRANTRFGWSAQRTLDIAQSLYEAHKLITYPRTDARHLSGDLRGEVPSVLDALATVDAYATVARTLRADVPRVGRRVFDDAKVSDHHAIIPTARAPGVAKLSAEESRLYDLVARSFLAAFMPDAEFELTAVVVVVGAGSAAPPPPIALDERPDAKPDDAPPERFVEALPPPPDRFIARGRVRKVAGWQEIAGFASDDERDAAQLLPALKTGQRLAARYASETKRTQPPKRYTEATLLAAMESCGKQVDDETLRAALKDSGIGTPATRASILETLLRRGYLARRERALVSTPTGEAVIDAVPVPALRSPELTGRWEARLARMARGEEVRERFMVDIASFVRELVDGIRGARAPMIPQTETTTAPPQPPVAARRRNRSPKLSVTPDTPAAATKRAPDVDPAALACPLCGAPLVTGRRAWGCSRWREGCVLVIPFEHEGRALSGAQLRELVTRGRTRLATWTSRGRAVRGRLRLDAKARPPALIVEEDGDAQSSSSRGSSSESRSSSSSSS